MITPYLIKVQIKNSVSVINHDHIRLCQDRELPKWLLKARHRLGGGSLYCHCRKPDTGRTMVQCNTRLEWYHCDCVGLDAMRAKRLPEYICTDCADAQNSGACHEVYGPWWSWSTPYWRNLTGVAPGVGNARPADATTGQGALDRGRRSRSLVVQTYESGRGLREQRSGNPAGPGREHRRYGDDGPGYHACEHGGRRHAGLHQGRGSHIHGDGRSQFLQPTSVVSVGSQTYLQMGEHDVCMEVGSPGNTIPSMTFESTSVMTSSVPHNLLITKGKGPKRVVTRGAPVSSTCTAGQKKVTQCTIGGGGCTFEGDFHKSHFVKVHLPSVLAPYETEAQSASLSLNRERSQALDRLRTLLACDTLQSLVDLAFQGVDLTRSVFPPQLLTSMREFSRYMGWEAPSVDSDWVEGRSPALLLFWRTLVPLVRRLSWRQQAAFAEWVPEAGTVTAEASQGVAVNTVSARAGQGAVASTVAASAAQGLEVTDSVLRDFDEYLSSAVTITDEEQMNQGEESSFTQATHSAGRCHRCR
ncbi:nucleosome-remodeling factor subunit nurf301 [Plakobranchus ocellatus]|uniref:Nucleosome-remodeling factor subunit nurf301 n=1 Tax=Plakobranchus ocellatus TaxID=259542 RepID=A0AAV4B3V3_9GAST|nr:nucleosome-remodeling factor subunit nurf301 [Plakobranchus ocellatus]